MVVVGPRAYAFYGHLVKGSLAVKVGDRVKTGQVLGRLGNSVKHRRATPALRSPRRPDAILDKSIPYEIDQLEVAGSGPLNEDGTLTTTGAAKRLERVHPLILSVVNFH